MSIFTWFAETVDPFGLFSTAAEGAKKAGTWVAEKVSPNKTKGLDPDVKQAASDLVDLWNEWYAEETGCRAFVFEGMRTAERQKQLVAEGRSQTFESKHLQGLAVDIWFEDAGNGHPIEPDDVPRDWYVALGDIGEQLGFTWGGRWKNFVDMVHFEA